MSNSEKSLERIANSLEELVSIISTFGVNTKLNVSGSTQPATTIEEEFYRIVTKVYLDEESEKRTNQKKRKSARRVSDNLGDTLSVFFEQKLPQFSVKAERGYLLFQRDNSVVAILKNHTDLGFSRGEKWYSIIENIVNISQKSYNVPADKVFFLITTMRNSLDNDHVRRVLGNQQLKNIDLLEKENRVMLESYLKAYVGGIKDKKRLPNPKDQVYFCSAEIHPNILASQELNNGQQTVNLDQYSWLKPGVPELINHLSKL